MGIFDALTGKAAKDAAAKNTALYNQYGTDAQSDLDKGFAGAMPQLDNAIDAYTPLSDLGAKYGRGTDLYMDSLGINGSEGNTRAVGAYQAGPGYANMRDEAIEGVARNANRFGAGGNEIQAVTDRASDLANRAYTDWQNRLAGFMPQEASAVSGAASGKAAGYGAKAGLYQTDATNRIGVRGNVASGIANSNTSAANAQMSASSNFWNGLMNLGGNIAKAAYGAPPTPKAA